MSLLDYLQLQEIDSLPEEIESSRTDDDEIELNDQVDELSLEAFWDKVVKDIHEDPDWFNFSND
ncbi:hypothetical protein HGB24_00140 [Candidatus Saccharibacteria bacterium]|nr:hypothetical protein [Candidatus Saccharibacteria bacterium]